MRFERVLVVCIIGALNLACTKETRQNPPLIASPATSSQYKSRIGSPVSANQVWPIPTDASQTSDGTSTQLVLRGNGKILPTLHHDVITGIAIVEYNTRGEVVSQVPFRVQALDLAPPQWRNVLMQMHQGDVRRAWIRDRVGKLVIVDIEMQRLVLPSPSDYGMPHQRK